MIAREPGTPIRVLPPGPGAVLRRLDVAHEDQDNVLWCWVACLKMVLEKQPNTIQVIFNGHNASLTLSSITQGDVATVVRGVDCRTSSMPSPCKQALPIASVVDAWAKFGFQVNGPIQRPFSFLEVKREIEAQRPIQIGIAFGEEGHEIGHSLLIYGFSENDISNEQFVYIQDPLTSGGKWQVPISDLIAGNPFPWRWTWGHLPKVPGGQNA